MQRRGTLRFADVKQKVRILVHHPIKTSLADMGIIHAVPHLVGSADKTEVVARVTGGSLVGQYCIKVIHDWRALGKENKK